VSKSPKLTIITVNLNNRDGLKETMKSVLSQNYNDFEFIIVDGGSIDTSFEKIREYTDEIRDTLDDSYSACIWSGKHSKITGGFFSELDSGIYHAMNKGIKKARGEYLLFLNSGDYLIDENVIGESFKSELKDDIISGNCIVTQGGEYIHNAIPPAQITFLTFFNRTIPHQSTFIRKKLFETLGYYNESYKIHADYDFFIKALIVNNCSYSHLALTISNYNLEEMSSSAGNKELSRIERDEILTKYIPSRILQDYTSWQEQQIALTPWLWIQRKKIIYTPLMLLYRLASFISGKHKKRLSV
jgi:glycosyltransferase involved in cell wall biosynthesis